VVAGKIGQSYSKLKEIPEDEQAEILQFLQKLEKEGQI
jgi:diadenosine tetraphosphate (Ap4A) HIT family hydrolase